MQLRDVLAGEVLLCIGTIEGERIAVGQRNITAVPDDSDNRELTERLAIDGAANGVRRAEERALRTNPV